MGWTFSLAGVIACVLSTSVFAAEPISLDGAFVQGGTVKGQVEPGARVTVDGRAVTVSPEGYLIFGFNRDHGDTATIQVSHKDGSEESRIVDIASRDYDIQRIDGLPPSKVTPRTPEQIAHIQRDVKMKSTARQSPATQTWFWDDFIWPLSGPITGVYGSQRILNGQPRRPHFGVDIAAPVGTDFVAPAAGIVTLAAVDMYFEGGLIFLDHGHGYTSAFLHISRADVTPGEFVEKGQVIGGVGARGRATGPHLDWRITWAGQELDPTFLVGPMVDQAEVEKTAAADSQ